MSNYLVSDTDLTSVANAIRTKGGTSAQLEFPTEFVSAIGAISGGGGAGAVTQDQDGYLVLSDEGGGGNIGGLANLPDISDTDITFAYMMSCIKNGNTAGGTVTYASAFANTEQLLLSTGLTTIHGFMMSATTIDTKAVASNTQTLKALLVMLYDDESPSRYLMAGLDLSANWRTALNRTLGTSYAGAPEQGTLRFDGGNIYYTARYNKNANYQLITTGSQIEWLAW